jgi:hypothetical protein
MTATASTVPARQLLATMTGEPLQPVRLYYSVPNTIAVTRVLMGLRCMAETETGAWLWHYEAEAAALKFARAREDLPAEVHPIILGCFRFPSQDKVVLEVRSYDRAIDAAKFFGSMFGPKVVLRRLRVLNRFLDASENAHGLDRIDKLLDHNVTKIDPAEAEATIEAAMAKGRTPEEKLRAYMAHAEERRTKDVPLVEDFPLAPEEETEDFQHLAATLRFRSIRCFEHWKGNTHITLADVIHLVVEKGGRGLSINLPR